jgi:hypothetical protein
MSNLRAAAQQALEALRNATPGPIAGDDDYAEGGWALHRKAISALRAALEQDDKDRVWIEERKAAWALQRKMAQENQERDRQRREYKEARNAALSAEHGEQQAVAWWDGAYVVTQLKYEVGDDWTPLYIHPPSQRSENLKSREWRGLKEWEINDGLDQLPTEDVCSWSFRKGVYFAEAALKEKNHE